MLILAFQKEETMRVNIKETSGVCEFCATTEKGMEDLHKLVLLVGVGGKLRYAGLRRFYVEETGKNVDELLASARGNGAEFTELTRTCLFGAATLTLVEVLRDRAIFVGKYCRFCERPMIRAQNCQVGVCSQCQDECEHEWGNHGLVRVVNKQFCGAVLSCDRCGVKDF